MTVRAWPPAEQGRRLVAGYELVRRVGSGGIGAVWLARDSSRQVAIKMLLPHISQDPLLRAMFFDEARIASRVSHPNVVKVLAHGDDDGAPFLVMEWLEGVSLWDLMSSKKVPLPVVLRILFDVCDGLHALHELKSDDGSPLGAVHRDVSPQNLIALQNGHVKIIDFGITKAKGRLAKDTALGVLRGKVHYLAPEQARFGAVDRRADVWAVGSVLYRSIAGNPPFKAGSVGETLERLRSGEPPPPLPEDTPEVVRALVMRALELDPDRRFPDMRALAGAIDATGLLATHVEVAEVVGAHVPLVETVSPPSGDAWPTKEKTKRTKGKGGFWRGETGRVSDPAHRIAPPPKKDATPLPALPRSNLPRRIAVLLVTAAVVAVVTRAIVTLAEGPAPAALGRGVPRQIEVPRVEPPPPPAEPTAEPTAITPAPRRPAAQARDEDSLFGRRK